MSLIQDCAPFFPWNLGGCDKNRIVSICDLSPKVDKASRSQNLVMESLFLRKHIANVNESLLYDLLLILQCSDLVDLPLSVTFTLV
jgi:hypothetical protein